jgi:pimeloyl-ACP methyl ester carboxylesterase
MPGADDIGFTEGLSPEPVFGGRVWVTEAGPRRAPGVVLIHGLGGGAARDFGGLLALLARDRHVVTLDLPGFGRSDKGNEHYTPGRYAEVVRHVAGQRIGGRYDLLGHSLGGAVALTVTHTAPEEVGRLILADVAGILHRQAYAEQLAFMGIDAIFGIDRLLTGAIDGVLGSLLGDLVRPLTRLEPDLALLLGFAPIRRKLLGADPARIAALSLIATDFGPALSSVAVPPLLIWGAGDRIAPLRTAAVLAARIPGAILEVIDGCGHVPMREAPDRFEELVTGWLAAPPRRREQEPALARVPSDRAERRSGEAGIRLAGDFDRIELDGCRDAVISGARTGSLRVAGSTVEIGDTRIDGAETGLEVVDSRVRITGGVLSGDVAIAVDGSNLDLAGVVVTGRRALARCAGDRPSDILFSVCAADGPRGREHLHGIRRVAPGRDL